MEPNPLLLLIRSLDRGGSERQLVTLANALHARGRLVEVAVFYAGGAFEPELHGAGIPVHDLGKRSRWDVFGFLRRFAGLLRRMQPDVLYSFLPEANLIALAARVMSPTTAVVWGVRVSFVDWSQFHWVGRVLFELGCKLSRVTDMVIYNSEAGRGYHVAHGSDPSKAVVIPNGIDTTLFAPSARAREEVRREWGIEPGERVVGCVGRIDPMKDHGTFLRAASLLARERTDVRFVVVGGGVAADVAKARRLGEELAKGARVLWVDEVAAVAGAYAALDIATLASIGEGFPNTVAEAMAVGVPCVVTDVGDACAIVAETGICVPPRDPQAMCAAWQSLLGLDPQELRARGLAARYRIASRYTIAAMADRTTDALLEAKRRRLIARRGNAPS